MSLEGALFARVVRRRNFAGLPFWVSASEENCAEIVQRSEALAVARGLPEVKVLAAMTAEDRGLLRERDLLPEHPVSFAGKQGFKRFFAGREGVHALLGEVEHWTHVHALNALDDAPPPEPDAELFARSEEYGFLTSEPSHAGPGAQFEAGVHLPALVATRKLLSVHRALAAMGFELRPMTRRAAGAAEAGFFRLLTRGGLGETEASLQARFAERTRALLAAESRALEQWRDRDPVRFEDEVHRAAGLLRSARRVEYGESLRWISRIRAGRRAGLVPEFSDDALEAFRVRAQPFHLSAANPDSPPQEEGRLRARLATTLLFGG